MRPLDICGIPPYFEGTRWDGAPRTSRETGSKTILDLISRIVRRRREGAFLVGPPLRCVIGQSRDDIAAPPGVLSEMCRKMPDSPTCRSASTCSMFFARSFRQADLFGLGLFLSDVKDLLAESLPRFRPLPCQEPNIGTSARPVGGRIPPAIDQPVQ